MKKLLTILFMSCLTLSVFVQKALAQTSENVGATGITFELTVTAVEPGSNTNVSEQFVITNLTGDNLSKEINLSIDPDSGSGNLMLSIGNIAETGYIINLYDNNGKQLLVKETNGNHTPVPMTSYPPATYFLKVLQGTKEIRSFKIIKN